MRPQAARHRLRRMLLDECDENGAANYSRVHGELSRMHTIAANGCASIL